LNNYTNPGVDRDASVAATLVTSFAGNSFSMQQPILLEILDLAGNRMGDRNSEILLNSLVFLSSLKILNLNKN
jgi:hypothetical protein